MNRLGFNVFFALSLLCGLVASGRAVAEIYGGSEAVSPQPQYSFESWPALTASQIDEIPTSAPCDMHKLCADTGECRLGPDGFYYMNPNLKWARTTGELYRHGNRWFNEQEQDAFVREEQATASQIAAQYGNRGQTQYAPSTGSSNPGVPEGDTLINAFPATGVATVRGRDGYTYEHRIYSLDPTIPLEP